MNSPELLIRTPAGAQSRVPIDHVPFRIGRHGDNDLVLRDSRASRYHADIIAEKGEYIIEDLKSSSGLFVNGQRVPRRKLSPGDRIDFGVPDSYQLTFQLGDGQVQSTPRPEGGQPAASPISGSSLSKLRATLEVARALQASLSTDEVLATVVEAALTITGCERGFLLLRQGGELQPRIARSRHGTLPVSDLGVPTRLLNRALDQRREFLSMDLMPDETVGGLERSIHDLQLRSIVCVPLVRIRSGLPAATASMSPAEDTVGLLYMDSRVRNADLSAGGRELLTTLALEASTVLENARLLEEQWARQRMEHELAIAQRIQESLKPHDLPETGWFRAAAWSNPSLEVGGDYLDVRQAYLHCWSAVIADVSGKGMGAALLASLLQGVFMEAPYSRQGIEEMMGRTNRFLNERTGGEQYATAFYATLDREGSLKWVNAGHLPPILLRGDIIEWLEAGGTPLGMIDTAEYTISETRLEPGDQIILYTDGVTEARNPEREFFGMRRLRDLALAKGEPLEGKARLAQIRQELEQFTAGAPQADDVTLAVLDFHGAA